MNQIDGDKKLLAPLLDRLITDDNQPYNSLPHQLIRQLRESVRRDLEHLLNTRYRCISAPENCQHLATSLVNYGLPDLSTINLVSKQSRQEFCQLVEQTILNYEPRIKSVRVHSPDAIDPEDPTIKFRIEALLHANAAQEIIVFDSAMNPINHLVEVSEIN